VPQNGLGRFFRAKIKNWNLNNFQIGNDLDPILSPVHLFFCPEASLKFLSLYAFKFSLAKNSS
jgi:hypothetical protein